MTNYNLNTQDLDDTLIAASDNVIEAITEDRDSDTVDKLLSVLNQTVSEYEEQLS